MKKTSKFQYLVYALLLTLLVPKEFYFKIGNLLLSPYRLVLLFVFPLVVIKYFRDKTLKVAFADVFVFLFSFWGALSHLINSGVAEGGASAGIFIVETATPYFAARVYIRSFEAFLGFARLYVNTVVVLFFLAALESVFVYYYVHIISGQITGQSFSYDIEARLGGLGRAMGPFDHPILYGAYCGSALGLIWFCYRGLKKYLYAAFCIGAVIWSMSSGPLLGVGFQLAFIGYELVTRTFRRRVLFIMVTSVIVLLALQAASDRSIIEVAVGRLTFEPQTAWFRIAIWQYATATIANYPLFGIAYQSALYDSTLPNWMQLGLNTTFSSSVDCLLLANTLFYGIPGGVFLFLSAVSAAYRVAAAKRKSLEARLHRASMGWTCSFIGLCFVSITVHYWGPMHVFFFFLLGTGPWLGDAPNRFQRQRKSRADTFKRMSEARLGPARQPHPALQLN